MQEGGEHKNNSFPGRTPRQACTAHPCTPLRGLLQPREGGVGAQHGRNLTPTFRTQVVTVQAGMAMVGERKGGMGNGMEIRKKERKKGN